SIILFPKGVIADMLPFPIQESDPPEYSEIGHLDVQESSSAPSGTINNRRTRQIRLILRIQEWLITRSRRTTFHIPDSVD
ncbi:hypothetical protein AC249_AIPGENE27950, partial [Exaiptasia diaphana]